MLDIRTLLLLTPEDRYQPTLPLRAAEAAVYPLLGQSGRRRTPAARLRSETTEPAGCATP